MNRMKSLSLLALTVMLVSSCVHISIGDNHETEVTAINQVTSMNTFDKIGVSGAMSVCYEQDSACTVRVEAPQAVFDKLVIYVKDKELHIGIKDGVYIGINTHLDQVKVYVTAPTLTDIDLAGSGSFSVTTALTVNDLNVDLAGSGHIIISQLSCHDLDVEVAGSGNATFQQVTARKVNTEVAGSGKVTYNTLQAERANSEIAGSGKIILSGSVQQHHETISGSGDIDTSGLK